MTPAPTIHPFPARMAPELALSVCEQLEGTQRVLDPMVGSGTTLRAALESGHRAVGFDVDPLAVLMATVWTTPIDGEQLRDAGTDLIQRAGRVTDKQLTKWFDRTDSETRSFMTYWFAPPQREMLQRLAVVLAKRDDCYSDPLRLALSSIIVTKESGASLARDVSHSRPHRVRLTNDYVVTAGFKRAVDRLATRLAESPVKGRADVRMGDARDLSTIRTRSVDAVITSPPYLNAIDYLRGHRLALVWLGWSLEELRQIRGESIGSERGLSPSDEATHELSAKLFEQTERADKLPARYQRILKRYAKDTVECVREIARVLKPGGTAVLVIGNSSVHGVFFGER